MSNIGISLESRIGNFIALRAGELWLVVSQDDVRSVGRMAALPADMVFDKSQRLFVIKRQTDSGEKKYYYAALSEEMELLSEVPKQRFLVAVLGNSPVYWCWDEIKILPKGELLIQTIPEVLKTPEMLVDEFVLFDKDKQGFVYTVDQLLGNLLDTNEKTWVE